MAGMGKTRGPAPGIGGAQTQALKRLSWQEASRRDARLPSKALCALQHQTSPSVGMPPAAGLALQQATLRRTPGALHRYSWHPYRIFRRPTTREISLSSPVAVGCLLAK